MRELSLHILDVAENSLRAGASLVVISLEEDTKSNITTIVISDNGCGMDEQYVAQVIDPFTTERTTRKVGLGLPMFAATAERCSGRLELKSKPDVGTDVLVTMERNHIDCPPIGDMATTLVSLLCNENETDILYKHRVDDFEFVLDTREVRQQLDGVPLTTPSIIQWLRDYIVENEEHCMQKGASINEISS